MKGPPVAFKKVTFNVPIDGAFTVTGTDYIDETHIAAYVTHQGQIGHAVTAIEDDDRPVDADRSYNPPAYLTGA